MLLFIIKISYTPNYYVSELKTRTERTEISMKRCQFLAAQLPKKRLKNTLNCTN